MNALQHLMLNVPLEDGPFRELVQHIAEDMEGLNIVMTAGIPVGLGLLRKRHVTQLIVNITMKR